ncbi:hypothetical protein ABZ654_04795 [Streptomyces hygroscopicus]|uniref:hypothetical protein n=1 Tax=Streptomyces hygroscopicus TaxID=1912 RepID=UPI0033C2CDE7
MVLLVEAARVLAKKGPGQALETTSRPQPTRGAAWLLHTVGHGETVNLIDRLSAGPLLSSPGLSGGLTGIARLFLNTGLKDEVIDLATRRARCSGAAGVDVRLVGIVVCH